MTDRLRGGAAANPADGRIIVKLSRRDAEDARRLLSLVSASDGLTLPLENTESDDEDALCELEPDALRRRARDILTNRRRRHDVFGKAIFGEPAWEMLLLLYAMETGQRQTIRSLSNVAELSKSTAVRWIDYLVARGLILREAHPTDRRATYVELTVKGKAAIELYLFEISSAGD